MNWSVVVVVVVVVMFVRIEVVLGQMVSLCKLVPVITVR